MSQVLVKSVHVHLKHIWMVCSGNRAKWKGLSEIKQLVLCQSPALPIGLWRLVVDRGLQLSVNAGGSTLQEQFPVTACFSISPHNIQHVLISSWGGRFIAMSAEWVLHGRQSSALGFIWVPLFLSFLLTHVIISVQVAHWCCPQNDTNCFQLCPRLWHNPRPRLLATSPQYYQPSSSRSPCQPP